MNQSLSKYRLKFYQIGSKNTYIEENEPSILKMEGVFTINQRSDFEISIDLGNLNELQKNNIFKADHLKVEFFDGKSQTWLEDPNGDPYVNGFYYIKKRELKTSNRIVIEAEVNYVNLITPESELLYLNRKLTNNQLQKNDSLDFLKSFTTNNNYYNFKGYYIIMNTNPIHHKNIYGNIYRFTNRDRDDLKGYPKPENLNGTYIYNSYFTDDKNLFIMWIPRYNLEQNGSSPLSMFLHVMQKQNMNDNILSIIPSFIDYSFNLPSRIDKINNKELYIFDNQDEQEKLMDIRNTSCLFYFYAHYKTSPIDCYDYNIDPFIINFNENRNKIYEHKKYFFSILFFLKEKHISQYHPDFQEFYNQNLPDNFKLISFLNQERIFRNFHINENVFKNGVILNIYDRKDKNNFFSYTLSNVKQINTKDNDYISRLTLSNALGLIPKSISLGFGINNPTSTAYNVTSIVQQGLNLYNDIYNYNKNNQFLNAEININNLILENKFYINIVNIENYKNYLKTYGIDTFIYKKFEKDRNFIYKVNGITLINYNGKYDKTKLIEKLNQIRIINER